MVLYHIKIICTLHKSIVLTKKMIFMNLPMNRPTFCCTHNVGRFIPMLVGIAIPVIVVPYLINSFVVNFEVNELTAKVFFLEAMIWESCIMIGLVPVNTHYRTVFEQSTVGMRIIDSSCQGQKQHL